MSCVHIPNSTTMNDTCLLLLLALEEEEEQADLEMALALLYLSTIPKRKEVWVQPFLQQRVDRGAQSTIVRDLQMLEGRFNEYFRMSRTQFDVILTAIAVKIKKQDTMFRRSIPPEERLAICLR